MTKRSPRIVKLNQASDPAPTSADLDGLGFDRMTVAIEGSPHGADAEALVAAAAKRAEAEGLGLIVRARLDLFAIDDAAVEAQPEAFAVRRDVSAEHPIDPRRPAPAVGFARARFGRREAIEHVGPVFEARLRALAEAGASGFVLDAPDPRACGLYRDLIAAVRKAHPDFTFIAATPGLPHEAARALADCGFDFLLSSLGWWDFRARWLVDEQRALQRSAPLIAEVTAEAARRAWSPQAAQRLLTVAVATGSGVIVPEELVQIEGAAALSETLALLDRTADFLGDLRLLTGPAEPFTALARSGAPDPRQGGEELVVLINPDLKAPVPLDRQRPLAACPLQDFERLAGAGDPLAPLAPGEARLLVGRPGKPVVEKAASRRKDASLAAEAPRLVVENLRPCVAGGRFPVKRVVGDRVEVEAHVYGDGHEQLAAELLWRACDKRKWKSVRMEPAGNDVWTASFPLDRMGWHEFTVEAWLDRFGGFQRDFGKKREAGVDQAVDFMEGRALVEQAAARASGSARQRLRSALRSYDEAADDDARAEILLSPMLALGMDEADDRPFARRAEPQPIDAERIEARYSSWYEIFPRSQSGDAERHGTFDDVIARLPHIREMGFDTLYFPPIHPIGRANRKGRNNTLTPAPDDPGSPYAIGSEEGGHDAIHSELGSFDDFRRLVAAAAAEGLEIALDFAIQCSPDHPWLKQHPDWFDWRPDGSIKYAENPPKKYQDIVNVDFYAEGAVPDLWLALRDVVLLWVKEGVKVFRVDNPHTKPFPFWEWMIGEVRARHPETIFLAEAFTRPKVMNRLAKIGFSQSYTYFTWRNSKAELTEYIEELTTSEAKEFFRPHFFVNTPDINPVFLQTSGRPGFQIRAALAATLSGLFGVYAGFEHCEAEPLPGREEYKDSEKYEIRPRPDRVPGDIVDDIALLNRLRRGHPALQTHLNTRFHNAWNDNILYYGKPSPDGADMILVAVLLDPHNAHECDFEIPLWEFGLPDDAGVEVEDLATGDRFQWRGKVQHMRLDPGRPYRLWRIEPEGARHG